MAQTLVKRLMDRVVDRINRFDMRPVFYEILEALDGCYLLFDVSGDDGGVWLYHILANRMEERPLAEVEGAAFRDRHFVMAVPDDVVYDLLLKHLSPAEAACHARWGGSVAAHPSWVYLKSARVFELMQVAVSLD